MKALLLTAPSRLGYVDFPDPPAPAPEEVRLRIRACGICGSDVHGWDGSTGRRQPPLIMGHEAAGEIAAVGAAVRDWRPGDRVTFDSTRSCGVCDCCRAGRVNLCADRRVFGVAPAEYRQHGAFAEFLNVPARLLYRLDDRVPFSHAAMAEPVAVALHAVGRVRTAPADTAVVIGAGMIGLLVVQALRMAGVARIVAADLSAARLALARELGATATCHSGTDDLVAEVNRLTGGRGADLAFEAVGLTPTVNLALSALRRGGSAVLVGNVSPATQDFPLQATVTRELNILGSCASAGEYPAALAALASGAIRVAPLISAVAPLAEGADWFARLSSREGTGFLKVILSP